MVSGALTSNALAGKAFLLRRSRLLSEREHQEWARLWEAVYGEPPPIAADIALTARILIQCLPPAGPYRIGAARPPRS